MYAAFDDKHKTDNEKLLASSYKSSVILNISTTNVPSMPQAPQQYSSTAF
jgi:hypothetical protein